MTLDELVDEIESKWAWDMGFPSARSQTGEGYTALVIGVETESAPHVAYLNEEEVVEVFKAAFDEYAVGKTGVLYWRIRPELHKHPIDGRFKVYCRLLISDKTPDRIRYGRLGGKAGACYVE